MSKSVSNTSKAIKGMSSQSVVTIVLALVEIVSFSIMSRLLTKEDFGYYAAITAITTIFHSFSETGIGSAIVQRKELTKRYIDNAFTLSLIFACFVALLLIALSGPLARMVLDESMKVPLMLMSITLFCSCLTSVNLSIMHRKLQFFRMGAIHLISLVVTTIVAIVLALKGFGYYSILTKAVLTSVITLLLSYFLCKQRYGIALDKTTFKSIFSFSGWLMASSFFRNFAQQADRLLMGRLLSVTDLGAYNRPKNFISLASDKFTSIFDSAMFPVLSSIQDDKRALARAFRKSVYYLNMLSMLLSLVLVFGSELIIRVFFGIDWLDLTSVFMVLSLTVIFDADARLADCYFRSLGLTKQQFFFRILELVIKVIALVIGSRWNIIGVAVAILIACIINVFLKICYVCSKIDVNVFSILGTIASSWQFTLFLLPIIIVATLFLPHTWLGNVILCLVFLVVVVVLFLFLPKLCGKTYYETAYDKIVGIVKLKLHLKK
jgi:PST family polysaccharide transporter